LHQRANSECTKSKGRPIETGRPALPLLGVTTSTQYSSGFLDNLGGILKRTLRRPIIGGADATLFKH
jgi:hypothetical protein